MIPWGDCFDNTAKSPITDTKICYSTEALKYAQSSYFTCVVFC